MGGKYGDRGRGMVKKHFTHIKKIFFVLLAVFILFDLFGDRTSKADINAVADETAKAAGFDDMTRAENRMIKRFYGVNPKEYDGAVLYAPQDNMDVHELFVVKLKDVSQQETIERAIEERLDTQIKSFEGYGAEQVALLKKHVLEVKGNYVFYMVGENAQAARKAFLNSL